MPLQATISSLRRLFISRNCSPRDSFSTHGAAKAQRREPMAGWTIVAALVRKGREPELHVGLPDDAFYAKKWMSGSSQPQQGQRLK